MSLLLKQIYNFISLLNSDKDTKPLAAGLALGLVLGFSPILSLQSFLVFLIVFFFHVQLGAAFLSAFFFKFVAFLLDPIFDWIGRSVLEADSLRSLFIALYNMPIVPFTRFNNSIVMGSGLVGFILAIPAFFLFRNLIVKYRATVVVRFKGTKAWKAFSATRFYKWFETYQNLYG